MASSDLQDAVTDDFEAPEQTDYESDLATERHAALTKVKARVKAKLKAEVKKKLAKAVEKKVKRVAITRTTIWIGGLILANAWLIIIIIGIVVSIAFVCTSNDPFLWTVKQIFATVGLCAFGQ